jgi:hypothetical protein
MPSYDLGTTGDHSLTVPRPCLCRCSCRAAEPIVEQVVRLHFAEHPRPLSVPSLRIRAPRPWQNAVSHSYVLGVL